MKKITGLILLVVLLIVIVNPIEAAINYQVKSGDTLWELARKFDTTVESIAKLNNLGDNYELYIGQRLIIDNNNPSPPKWDNNHRGSHRSLNRHYRVRSNENLAEIAEYFNLSERTLRVMNRLGRREDVYTGQLLKMPASPALSRKHKICTVRANNMPIHELAYQNGISIRSILQANYLTDINAKFRAGTTLIIPLDQDSKAVWVDYENGKPVNSLFN